MPSANTPGCCRGLAPQAMLTTSVTSMTAATEIVTRAGCGLPPGLGVQEARAMSITLPEDRKACAL